MHHLPLGHQLEFISLWADTRNIDPNDRYLSIYPELLQGVQALLPLNRRNLILIAHAIFGWMPTQLKLDMNRVDDALEILNNVLLNQAIVTVDDIALLADIFQTTNGRSVVAASKILHFLAPDRFPIWDSRVAAMWGVRPNGRGAAVNYHHFLQACLGFIGNDTGQQACVTLRNRLMQAGYAYPMTDMRVIELIFFLPL
jgi:hypothetical protein